jgi:hypothetical protein
MRTFRFPIAGLMGTVLVVAIALAALRNASETWAGVTFLMTCAVLCLAIVGVVCRGGRERAWWLGFALFGWGYLLLSLWSTVNLPTMTVLDVIAERLGMQVRFSGGMGGGMRNVGLWAFGGFGGGFGGLPDHRLQEIAHCLWALVVALLGGFLARALFGGSRAGAENLVAPPQAGIQTSRGWWVWPSVLGLAGGVFIMFLSLIGSRSSPGFWVGATFLTTCALLGITILGAVGDHGRRRHLWLGAAIFGVSYMAMAFGRSLDRETWPSLPTDHLLQSLRPWFPPVVSGFPTSSDGVAAANARIWETLERPIPMHFIEDTPLEDVLKHVQTKTRGADGKGIPVYVDPIGLQECEKSMTSTVRNIDLEGVPLKTSLRLCLAQLDMTYRIRDGVLFITSEESAITPIYQDPFLIMGHCVLALLAAGFGGLVAPLFSDMHR